MITRKEKIKELKTTRLMTKLIFHKFKVLKLERRLEKLGVKVDLKPKEKTADDIVNENIAKTVLKKPKKENKKYAKK